MFVFSMSGAHRHMLSDAEWALPLTIERSRFVAEEVRNVFQSHEWREDQRNDLEGVDI